MQYFSTFFHQQIYLEKQVDFEKQNIINCKPDIKELWRTYFAKSEQQDSIKEDEFLNGLVQISQEKQFDHQNIQLAKILFQQAIVGRNMDFKQFASLFEPKSPPLTPPSPQPSLQPEQLKLFFYSQLNSIKSMEFLNQKLH